MPSLGAPNLNLFETWSALWPTADTAEGRFSLLNALHTHVMVENQNDRGWLVVERNVSEAPPALWEALWLPMAQSVQSDVQVLARDTALRRLQRLGLDGNDHETAQTLKVLLQAPQMLGRIISTLAAQDGRWQRPGDEIALLRKIVEPWVAVASSDDIHQALTHVRSSLGDSVAGILLPALLNKAAPSDRLMAVGQAVFHGQSWATQWLTEQVVGSVDPEDACTWVRKAASARNVDVLAALWPHVPAQKMPELAVRLIDGHNHQTAQILLEHSDPQYDPHGLALGAVLESGYLQEYYMEALMRHCPVTDHNAERLSQAWVRCGHLHGGGENAKWMQRHLVSACPMAMAGALQKELAGGSLFNLPAARLVLAQTFDLLPDDAKTASLPIGFQPDPNMFPMMAAWMQKIAIAGAIDDGSMPKKQSKM